MQWKWKAWLQTPAVHQNTLVRPSEGHLVRPSETGAKEPRRTHGPTYSNVYWFVQANIKKLQYKKCASLGFPFLLFLMNQAAFVIISNCKHGWAYFVLTTPQYGEKFTGLCSSGPFKEHTRRGCKEHSTKRACSAASNAVMGLQQP